jgi:isocitrate/isopropylmalate dehydrogenase
VSISGHPRSEPASRTPLQIVALGGEGIGVEVVDATCALLTAAGFPLRIVRPPHGESAQRSHGSPPDETKRLCGEADGVLFGAAGSPASSTVVSYLRWHLTRDQGGTPTTGELCRAVLDALR